MTSGHLNCGCGRRKLSTPNAHRTANTWAEGGSQGIIRIYDAEASEKAAKRFRQRAVTSLLWRVHLQHYSDQSLVTAGSSDRLLDIDMVARAVFARQNFSLTKLLQRKFIYGVRTAPKDLVQQLLFNTECKGARLDIPLTKTSLVHAQRRLRANLTAKLQAGADEAAFARLCGVHSRPRADDPEAMAASFPGWDDIDWDAAHVESSLNLPLWRKYHSWHCQLDCTAEVVSKDCYFRLIHHFLDTGFEPALLPGETLSVSTSPTRAYVDLWNKNLPACRTAFAKWLACDTGFLSPQTSVEPTACCPLLPVVKRKHIWRSKKTGIPANARLCLDLLTSGQNAKCKDWKFRYWGFESIAERVQQGDWLVVLDISKYFLRLPGGRKMRRAQFFQDPASYGMDSRSNDALPASKIKWRQLLSVAFGWKQAPAFASMVSAELVRILRSQTVDVAGVFLDDILIRASSKGKASRSKATALDIMKKLNLPANAKIQGPCAPYEGADYLGVLVRTDDCSLRISEEYRQYAIARLAEILEAKQATVQELETIAGMLTWLSVVMIQARPRRAAVYGACSGARKSIVKIRGKLSSELHWHYNELRSDRWKGVRFWKEAQEMPLVLSDASGEDGWGVCALGLHIFGVWPECMRGNDAESMLFKETLPPVLTALILAPLLRGKLLCCALDNAGAAYVLNALSCFSASTRALLTPLTDSMVRFRFGLLADHARRHRNAHADALPRAISQATWMRLTHQVRVPVNKIPFHFVVLDTVTGDCRIAVTYFSGLRRANAVGHQLMTAAIQPQPRAASRSRRRRRRGNRVRRA